ncbi:MAG: hypothetical protein ACYSSM_02400 [Planctomycetota bacterium]|jgi:hypothetical protein
MAVPTYATDLTLIDDAQDVSSYSATGGGAGGLADETDYFINNIQCISKAGFTAVQKGIIHDDVSAPSIAAGDAVFIWARQANRNIMETVALDGGAVIMGTSNAVFEGFTVDGSDVEGSELLAWVNYAVDPTQTPSYSSGSPGAPSTWDHFGFEWTIGSSGSLKGNPNGVGISRHGRELQVIDGQAAAYGTFLGAANTDATVTNRWGILTPVAGGYQFHGAFVMGTTATAVDFRDSDRSISVLDDPFLPAGFNEFEIRNASSNVEWTNIIISHLGINTPSLLTLNVGTFTGELNQFTGFSTTTFASTSSCVNSTWTSSGRINLNEADISGSSILASSVAADEGAVFDDRTTTAATNISELDNCTFSQGTAAHHAIRFGANVDDNIVLTGIAFNGFAAIEDDNGCALRFDATTGSLNCSLVGCTVDGVPATALNLFKDDAAGVAVTLVFDVITLEVTVLDATDDTPITTAHVQLLKNSDKSVLLSGAVNGSGVITDTIAYDADTPVIGWAREHNVLGTDYIQQDFSGEYTINGFFITIRLFPAE